METITLNGKTEIEVRFENRLRKTNYCWEWIGNKLKSGYGRMQYNGHRLLAHRLSYMLNVGSIFPGMEIHHKCNNKSCVNPNHLEQVTSKENNRHYQNIRYGDGNGVGY